MTACRNKARGAVVAALAGALTLGAAPVIALADGASLMTATDVSEIKNSTVTAAIDENRDEIEDLSNISFEADGNAHYVVPTEVTNVLGDVYDVEDDGLQVTYYAASPNNNPTGTWLLDADGERIYVTSIRDNDPENITAAGKYYVGVFAASGAVNAANSTYLEFTLASTTLSDAYVCDAADTDDTSLEYIASVQALGRDFNVALNGHVLNSGTEIKAWVYKAGDTTFTATDVENVGDYVIRVEGRTGSDYEGQSVDIPFSIVPVDLADASIVLDQDLNAVAGTAAPTVVRTVDGSAALAGEVTLKFDSASNGALAPSDAQGAYTYRVVPTDSEDEDIVNYQEITVIRYARPATFRYDRQEIADGQTIERFDPTLVDARGGNAAVATEISYEKQDSNGLWHGVDAAATQYPGTYRAIITAVDDDYTYGGSVTVNFAVAAIDVVDTDVYVTYMGEVVEEGEAVDVYSGSDLSGNVSVRAFDEDGEEVPASEFDVVITNEDGDEVDEVVDAGEYTVNVKNKADSMYQIVGGDDSVTFEVLPVVTTGDTATDADNADIRFDGVLAFGATNQGNTYAYTGEAVVPTFQYDLTWGRYADSEDWVSLPADAYRAEYEVKTASGAWKPVDECVEPGTYRVVLSDNAKDGNHDVDGTYEFVVSKDRVFLDVANDQWYSEYVYQVRESGWMTGYGMGLFFGPADSIKRGDVAMTLYRMAGQPDFTDEGSYDENKGYLTGFSDVDGNAYYAKAILWAKSAGIVSGDGGKDTFRPNDTVTREELAKMLAIFADKCGEDTDVDADAVLGGYEDESSVSDWARGYVAYLVEAGVMGKDSGLKGNQPISRAEVAAMAVRLSDVFDFKIME